MSEPAREPRIHGVLVTFERPDELRASLDALGRQTRQLDTLVVVDNSAGRESEAVVATADVAGRLDYVAAGSNLGPAGGIALGMEHHLQHADDLDWLCLLDDDDPLSDPGVLSERVELARSVSERIAALGGRGGVLDRRTGRLRPCEPGGAADYLASGYCPLYRVRAIRSVGVFAPELFFGFDDLEFGMRLTAAGWGLTVAPRTDAQRAPEGSSPAWVVGPLEWRRYYSLRNLVHLLRVNGCTRAAVQVSAINGIAKPLANLPLHPRLAWSHLDLNARAIRDGWKGQLGLTVRPDSARRVGKAS
jgi:GT2 family glycosyltransferase